VNLLALGLVRAPAVHLHPLQIAGVVILVISLCIYLGEIVAALLRVRSQYSRAMAGAGGLRISAALAAAARFWPFLVGVLIGVALIIVGR
jgi:hypothetical protein